MKNYSPGKNLLVNKNIIVTGAANGIGQAVAKGYATHGATVILIDKDERGLEKTYDDILTANAPEPVLVPMDFLKSEPQNYEQVAASIENELGGLDGIAHCAGWLGTLTPLLLYDDLVWSKVMMINLQSPYWLTRACIGLLQKSATASVIFTTSLAGRQPKAYWGAFAIASAGLENLALTWSDELEGSGNIRFNTLDPGPVRTKMRANAYPGEDPADLPRPDELTPIYLYLMGDDSSKVQGQQLTYERD